MQCTVQKLSLSLLLLQCGGHAAQKLRAVPVAESQSLAVSPAVSEDSRLQKRLAKFLFAIEPTYSFGLQGKPSLLGATRKFLKGYASGPRATPPRSEQEDSSVDWREMRARLVQQERAEQQGISTKEIKDGGWVYESPLIEQGSVLLADPNQMFGWYGQEYFHKSVLLILSHSDRFTRGIIINRPTTYKIEGWRVWMGGDCETGGMFRNKKAMEFREICCLHSLTGRLADAVSNNVIKGVSVCGLDAAQALIAVGAAQKSDFCVFVGYAGWGPGQLQSEVDRVSWMLASADASTLLNELLRETLELSLTTTESVPDDGVSVWERLMTAIGRQEEVDATKGNQLDKSLKDWVRQRLVPPGLDDEKKSSLGEQPRYAMSRSDAIVATCAAILFQLKSLKGVIDRRGQGGSQNSDNSGRSP